MRILLVAALLLCSTGCFDLVQSPRVIDKIPDVVQKVEPAIREFENAVGTTLSDKTISKAERVFRIVKSVADKGGVVAGVVASLPTPAQPFALGLSSIMGIVGTAAGGMLTILQRRRARRAELGLTTVVNAVDRIPDVGKLITSAARTKNTVAVIEDAYNGKLTA